MEAQAFRLQETLWHEIPLTQAIGLRVAGCDRHGVELAAPLAPNINHKDTAFAGSINALLTLAGWSVVWCLLEQDSLPGTIVIQDSSIEYLHPVTADFSAYCRLPEPALAERFLVQFRRRGRARLELSAEIGQGGRCLAYFRGRYVVMAPK